MKGIAVLFCQRLEFREEFGFLVMDGFGLAL